MYIGEILEKIGQSEVKLAENIPNPFFGFKIINLIVFISLMAHRHNIRGKTQHEWLTAS